MSEREVHGPNPPPFHPHRHCTCVTDDVVADDEQAKVNAETEDGQDQAVDQEAAGSERSEFLWVSNPEKLVLITGSESHGDRFLSVIGSYHQLTCPTMTGINISPAAALTTMQVVIGAAIKRNSLPQFPSIE